MSLSNDTFFTSVGCMDGRVQNPIAEYGVKKFNAKYSDTITEAGLVGLLSGQHLDKELINSIGRKITISLEKHNSKGIIVHGHESCTGNPVSEEKHKEDILKTKELMEMIFPGITILPVYVKKKNGDWIVEEL